jgi:hypothetical protein
VVPDEHHGVIVDGHPHADGLPKREEAIVENALYGSLSLDSISGVSAIDGGNHDADDRCFGALTVRRVYVHDRPPSLLEDA